MIQHVIICVAVVQHYRVCETVSNTLPLSFGLAFDHVCGSVSTFYCACGSVSTFNNEYGSVSASDYVYDNVSTFYLL